MAAISFKVFRGMVPRRSERLLSANYAQRATNCKITSGALDPLDGPQLSSIIGRTIRTMYRYRYFQNNEPVDNWLTWDNDVDVCLSPLSNDERGRVYLTSEDHEPRYTSAALALTSTPYPATTRPLGVPSPIEGPRVYYDIFLGPNSANNGGSGDRETRFSMQLHMYWEQEKSQVHPLHLLVSMIM